MADPLDPRALVAAILVIVLGAIILGGGKRIMEWHRRVSIRGHVLRLSASVHKEFTQQNERLDIIETDVREVKHLQASMHEEAKDQRSIMEKSVQHLTDRVDSMMLRDRRRYPEDGD